MRNFFSGQVAVFAQVLLLVFSTTALAQPNSVSSKRVVYYYQTQFSSGDSGTFNSLLPLTMSPNLNQEGQPYTTDVLVGAFHLGPEKDQTEIHLNDFPPNNSRFDQLWEEVPQLQSSGINVNMFLGGASDQSFVNLAANFTFFYPILKQTLETYNFNGIDLDVEDNAETTEQIETVIQQLRSDFGESFIITLAPVASDLQSNSTAALSNINYSQLYTDLGSNISWYNAQFYSGFGSLATPTDYDTIVTQNGYPAEFIVAGMLTNSADGSGFVSIEEVEATVQSLISEYPTFGGVDGFEYFNAEPGGTANPAEWGTTFGTLMA